MERTVRIVVGLALIGYGLYSGNAWFYLGVIPLLTGVINWCPMKKIMGGCECSTGSCGTPAFKDNSTSCCSTNDTKKSSCCSTPDEQIKEFKASSASEKACCSSTNSGIVIKILGTGCSNCIALKKVVDEAVLQLDENITVIKEEDVNKIMEYKVMSMPGLVINEKVISAGKLLSLDEVKEYIKKEQKS